MRLLVAALLLSLGCVAVARAQSESDQREIQHVISSQIEAFRHDDGAAAFAFASPDVQSVFGSPDRFMAMVRRLYLPVYRPRSVTFGSLIARGQDMVQRVEVIGPDGRPHLALYTMVREADGTWRVDACELAESDDVAA